MESGEWPEMVDSDNKDLGSEEVTTEVATQA